MKFFIFERVLNMPRVLNMLVLHRVSVENGPSYMFDRVLRVPRILNMLRLEYTRVCEYAKVAQGSV